MVIRRITTLACAFCLAVPAAAGASHQPTVGSADTASAGAQTAGVQDTVGAKGPYGVTLARPPQDTVEAKGPYGVTLARPPQDTIEAKGPYGVTLAHPPQNTIEAKGPYGVTLAAGSQVATKAKAQRADTSRSDDASSWRAVAISEAALLALALGSALLIVRRRRVARMGA
jgi:hypothetical protein